MIYLFQHLPKCGGNSFITSSGTWFAFRQGDQAGSYPGKEQLAEFAKKPLDLDRLPDNTLVHGHLVRPGIRPQERYGDYLAQKKCALFSIVRNPLERAISGYFHRIRVGRQRETTLSAFIARLENPMAKQLGCLKIADREAWLDQYLFIAVCDEMQLSFDVLAAKLGKPRLEAKRLNQSPRDSYELSPDDIARFGTRNAIDYAIFDYAVARLHREAAEVGVPVS
jgi:hypothetical protein